MSSEWHLNPVHSLTLVTICGALLLAALFWLGRETSRLSPGRHWTLFGLRLLVFLAVILLLLRPTLVTSELKEQSASICVMVDDSRSMQTEDELNGTSRWNAVQQDLRQSTKVLDELAKKYELEIVRFSQESQPFGSQLDKALAPDRPTGSQTAIGGALEDLLRRANNKRLAAVILQSDGAQQAYPPRDQSPQSAARRLADLGTPLYTIPYGQERSLTQSRDLAVTELLAGPTVYVKNILTATGTIRLNGYVNQPIQVQLLYETAPGKEEVVGSATVTPQQPDDLAAVEISFTPEKPGEHKLTLRVLTPDGTTETVTNNNQLSTFVTVLEGGLNILYLEGEARVEQRFLRRSLNFSPDMRVDFEFFDPQPKSRARWPINLEAQLKPGKYNAYILGDVDSTLFRPADLEQLARNVEQGAGLILLGGYHSFWAGGYDRTPLARIMPLQPTPLERQNFNEPIRRDLHLPGPLQMIPDAGLGQTVSFLKLAPKGENENFWKQLPALKGANKWTKLKVNAKVLARSQHGDPLIAAVEPGQGRVLAFAGDTTWQWVMQGFESAHKTFWRQAILWVLKIDESANGTVWVKLDQRRVSPGRRIDFTTGVRGVPPEIADQANFTAVVHFPDGKTRNVSLANTAGEWGGSFGETLIPGEYRIEVAGDHDGKALGMGKARFIVLDQDLELNNAAARPSLLQSLSLMTAKSGGKQLARNELANLLEELLKQPPVVEVETQVKHTPWDRPEVLLFIVGLLTLEWYLRKKWGWV
ncbi:MAG: hypothetical protein SFX18_11480 [Pirellulales bacterium]|nr:hypothetical protein [Pirellulales bacterium]